VNLRRIGRGGNENAQDTFRKEYDALDKNQRGAWCERAVVKEARQMGHTILVEHIDLPNEHGFDCVSLDPKTKELHVWEAKNYGRETGPVTEKDVTAWKDIGKDGLARKGYQRSWQEAMDKIPDGPDKELVKTAINEGRVTFHLRLGPDTRVNGRYQHELNSSNVPGSQYDCARYTYRDMLKIGSGA
jgi:hypothetical protein